MELKDKLLKLRKDNHLSQQQIADRLNVSRQSISKWELGDSQPDIHNIIMISEIFGVSTDYLLKDEIEENHKNKRQVSTFLGVSTLIVLLGAIVGYMLWNYYFNSISLLCGITIQIIGCALFEYFALKENDMAAQKIFLSINIWLLFLLPIKYFSEYTRTYSFIETLLWRTNIGGNLMGTMFITYFPFVLSLLLSFVIFLLIRKIF